MKNIYFKSVKGMKDYFDNNILIYNYLENVFKDLIKSYSFNEVKFPILEKSFLYNRNFYRVNNNFLDNKMYSFLDKNNISLSLRPEGTMSCVRMYLEHKMFNFIDLKKI